MGIHVVLANYFSGKNPLDLSTRDLKSGGHWFDPRTGRDFSVTVDLGHCVNGYLSNKSCGISSRSLTGKLVITDWLFIQESRLGGPTAQIWPKRLLKSA